MSRAAPAFCRLNGKTEERNERRGEERASEQVTYPLLLDRERLREGEREEGG